MLNAFFRAGRETSPRRFTAEQWGTQVDKLVFGSAIAARRSLLQTHFDVRRQFEEIEESCIPSYVHGNKAAAWVSTLR